MASEELVDEIGAIEAIYPDHVKKISELTYEFKVPQHESVSVQMSFPESYPEAKPHVLQVVSVKTSRQFYDDKYLKALFEDAIDSIFTEDLVCVFDFFTEVESILHNESVTEEPNVKEYDEISKDVDTDDEPKIAESFSKMDLSKDEPRNTPVMDALEGWVCSEPITDRKSTFQAFIKEVHSVSDAMEALELLKQDKKIARSAHNMSAYRIKKRDVQYQDCDDDGESAAGGRMLHLLTIMDAWNCIVVVSRWFGGIHIGPDRFKHINSATRDAVMKSGLGKEDKKPFSKSKKKR